MNLLFTKIFGKLWSTEKMDEYISSVKNGIKRYNDFIQSPLAEQYKELYSKVSNPEYIKKKEFIQNRKYQNTTEYKKIKQLKSLSSSLSVRLYYYFLKNENVQTYLNNKRDNIESDPKLIKSFAVKKFLSYRTSPTVIQYLSLKKETEGEEFKKNNAFWANPKRWQLHPDSKFEKEYLEFCKQKEVKTFLKINQAWLHHFERFCVKREEDYSTLKFEDSMWCGGFYYNNDALKRYHSYMGQVQAFNEGRNIDANNGVLSILWKKENSKQAAWQSKKGFILCDYTFTSDVINTGKALQMNTGMVILKVRCQGDVHHVISLQNIDKTVGVQLFNCFENKLSIGLRSPKSSMYEIIKGISAEEWYYYFFIWNRKELIWLVNNKEILRVPNSLGSETLYLQAISYLTKNEEKKRPHSLSGALQIASVGVYDIPDNTQKFIFSEK